MNKNESENFRGLVMFFVVVVIGLAMPFVGGCAYQNTDGTTRKVLPVEFGIYARAALASGETEQRVGLGKNATAEVMQANTGFNEARAEVGIAEAQNKMNSVSYSGSEHSSASLNLTPGQRVTNALEMKK